MWGKRLRSAIAVAAGLAMLAGCGSGEGQEKSGPIAIVVGNHANGNTPAITNEVEGVLRAGTESGTSLSVIVADGRPTVDVQLQLKNLGNNDLTRNQSMLNTLEDVTRTVESVQADSPEVDLLGAISLAGRAVSGPEPGTVIVMDSGLQTTGVLKFQNDGGALLSADSAEVVDQLRRNAVLPNLSGVRVLFTGLGSVSPPQAPLGEAALKRLETLWVAIVSAAGAVEPPQVDTIPLAAGVPDAKFSVSVVPIPSPPALSLSPGPTVLVDAVTGFIPNTATFADPDNIGEVLSQYARQLVESGRQVTVTGTTVRIGTKDGEVALSRARAQSVADILVGQGVSPANISVVGAGSDFPGYLPDRDNAGNLDPVRAAQNRQVILTVAGAQ